MLGVIFVWTCDNGTSGSITNMREGRTVKGGKTRTTENGVNAPFIVSCPGLVPEGVVSDALVDFSDMMPTFVEMAGAAVPVALQFDGVSFLPQLRGEKGTPKPYIFCYYEKGKYHGEAEDDSKTNSAEDKTLSDKVSNRLAQKGQPTLWVHDGRWKLLNSGNFYDLDDDPNEQSPIAEGEAGPKGERKRALFEKVLREKSKIHKSYGPATLTDVSSS